MNLWFHEHMQEAIHANEFGKFLDKFKRIDITYFNNIGYLLILYNVNNIFIFFV